MLFRYFLIILSLSYGSAKAGDLYIPKDIILNSLTAEDKIRQHIDFVERHFNIHDQFYRIRICLLPAIFESHTLSLGIPSTKHNPTLEQAVNALEPTISFQKEPEYETKWMFDGGRFKIIYKRDAISPYSTEPDALFSGKQYSCLSISLKMLSAAPTGEGLILRE